MTGEAHRWRLRAASHWRAARAGKARKGRPGSQETCSDPKPKPSWKGVAPDMNPHRRSGLAAGILGLGLLAPAAAHAGVPVNLRIEGPTKTVFEDRIDVPVQAFRFSGQKASHECDGVPQGTQGKPVPTRGAALSEAAARFGFSLHGTWSDDFQSPTITRVGGQDVDYDAGTQRYLAEFLDGKASMLGSCAERLHRGDDVLFAYSTGSEPLLELHGPKLVRRGDGFTVRVTAGGKPVAGAKVGRKLTDASGRATLQAGWPGYRTFKATKSGTVRSNRVRVCVPGICAPVVRITDIRDGRRFRRADAPKRFRGVVENAPSGLKSITLLLTRRAQGHTTHRTLHVHRAWDFSRRLPARLGRGRYVLEARARDRHGRYRRDKVVFSVR